VTRRTAPVALAIAVVVGGLGLARRVAVAEPGCEAITATVDADAGRARVWNLGWGIGFALAAAGQAAAAAALPQDSISDDTRAGLWVGAVKASVGAVGRFVVPLRLARARDCADAPHALAVAARRERVGFWLNTTGGLAVNLAGLLYLGLERDAWGTGALSFAIGTVVSIASAYTAPRRAWRAHPIVVAPTPGGVVLSTTW